jgi:hypothetical protein
LCTFRPIYDNLLHVETELHHVALPINIWGREYLAAGIQGALAAGNWSALPRTPGGVAPYDVNHEVTGRILVIGEPVRIDADERERQDGGVRRQWPVAARSAGRVAALERKPDLHRIL